MKMLVERIPTTAPDYSLDIGLIKEHVRVTEDEDNAALIAMSMTAAAEVEQMAQYALLDQMIRVTILNPLTDPFLMLPIGALSVGTSISVTIDGVAFNGFAVATGLRPVIIWETPFIGLTPKIIVIEYQAGFGADWSSVPYDLKQAVLDQTALHFDGRSPMSERELTTSPHLSRIAARYRGVSA